MFHYPSRKDNLNPQHCHPSSYSLFWLIAAVLLEGLRTLWDHVWNHKLYPVHCNCDEEAITILFLVQTKTTIIIKCQATTGSYSSRSNIIRIRCVSFHLHCFYLTTTKKPLRNCYQKARGERSRMEQKDAWSNSPAIRGSHGHRKPDRPPRDARLAAIQAQRAATRTTIRRLPILHHVEKRLADVRPRTLLLVVDGLPLLDERREHADRVSHVRPLIRVPRRAVTRELRHHVDGVEGLVRDGKRRVDDALELLRAALHLDEPGRQVAALIRTSLIESLQTSQ